MFKNMKHNSFHSETKLLIADSNPRVVIQICTPLKNIVDQTKDRR